MNNFKLSVYYYISSLSLIVLGISLHAKGQAKETPITVYQYRHVPDDKIDEFLKRETTYWSKVAEKALKDKKMTFWALLQKIGGHDLPNSSNFLFVNVFPNVDKASDVFSNVESVAGVKMADMETNSMSTITSEFFLVDQSFVQGAKAVPAKDFNYLEMVYHNTYYADSLLSLENKYWSPFIKKAFDAGQTAQVAWGNSKLIAPLGEDIKFTTVSYDLYRNLQDMLLENWDPKTVFPVKGQGMIAKIEIGRRGIELYRIVKVVAPN